MDDVIDLVLLVAEQTYRTWPTDRLKLSRQEYQKQLKELINHPRQDPAYIKEIDQIRMLVATLTNIIDEREGTDGTY